MAIAFHVFLGSQIKGITNRPHCHADTSDMMELKKDLAELSEIVLDGH